MLFQFKSEEVQTRIVDRLHHLDKLIRDKMEYADCSKEVEEESSLNKSLMACTVAKTTMLTQEEVVTLFREVF